MKLWPWIVALLAGVGVFLYANRASAEPAPSTAEEPSPIGPDSFNSTTPDAIDEVMSVDPDARSRGERNNNPGNVRYNAADQWKGLIGHDDAGYCIFSDAFFGVRAMTVLIHRYYNDYYLTSVRQIISRYAPASENPTASYVANVAGALQVSPDKSINVNNDAIMQELLTAMIQQENGRVLIAQSQIAYGISLAS